MARFTDNRTDAQRAEAINLRNEMCEQIMAAFSKLPGTSGMPRTGCYVRIHTELAGNGSRVFQASVYGAYEIRDALKSAGFRFDSLGRVWVTTSDTLIGLNLTGVPTGIPVGHTIDVDDVGSHKLYHE